MEFKDRLKELRKEKGVSQDELARAVYKSRSTVAKWETGLRLPDSESLELLAEYFGVEVSSLSPDGVAEDASPGEIVKIKKTLSRQEKIIIAVSCVLGAIILAWVIICIVGLIAMNRPVYPLSLDTYWGVVGYSEEYGEYYVYIEGTGLCEIPELSGKNPNYTEYAPQEGDVIFISFLKSDKAAIRESYPAIFTAKANSIYVGERNVAVELTDEGYLFTCETQQRFSEFSEGDKFYVILHGSTSYGGDSISVYCIAQVVSNDGELITLLMPYETDMSDFLYKFAYYYGYFSYSTEEYYNELFS